MPYPTSIVTARSGILIAESMNTDRWQVATGGVMQLMMTYVSTTLIFHTGIVPCGNGNERRPVFFSMFSYQKCPGFPHYWPIFVRSATMPFTCFLKLSHGLLGCA
jgi:hypothetical protein